MSPNYLRALMEMHNRSNIVSMPVNTTFCLKNGSKNNSNLVKK